jgi:hypothetical protein
LCDSPAIMPPLSALRFAIAEPQSEAERIDRARLVKQGYTAMLIAFCNIAAHKLVCVNPDLQHEYEELSRSERAPAESLDRKAWTALMLNRKASAGRGHPSPHMARHVATAGAKVDTYLQTYAYQPPG